MYDRKVDNATLTFCVSGQLWNRSLLMMDTETKSLWSHILGEAMDGELKGKQLTARPADMMTWAAWKQAHKETTVLAMRRTRHREYTNEFYRDPSRFVVGFRGNNGMRHCTFESLQGRPLQNIDADGLPLLITFDAESTSTRLYDRRIDGQLLTFTFHDGKLKDDQTGSEWDRTTGSAIGGPLSGKQLEPHLGIVSDARAWSKFHPRSRKIEG